MSSMELGSAVQEKLPIIVVVIMTLPVTHSVSQDRHFGDRHIGVDLQNPDFCAFAASFGVRSWRVQNDNEFACALEEAMTRNEPGLIEVALVG